MTYLLILTDGQEIGAESVWLNGDNCVYVDDKGSHTIKGNDLERVCVAANATERTGFLDAEEYEELADKAITAVSE